MRKLLLRLVPILALMLGAPVAPGGAGELEPKLRGEVQGIITQQIEAFRADDGTKAFSFADPIVQLKFQNPTVFMGMVRQGYAAVYRPQSFAFTDASEVEGGLIRQLVDIVGPDGGLWTAEYLLRRQPDGSLKIAACALKKRDGVGT